MSTGLWVTAAAAATTAIAALAQPGKPAAAQTRSLAGHDSPRRADTGKPPEPWS
jgi:hypothetical protein